MFIKESLIGKLVKVADEVPPFVVMYQENHPWHIRNSETEEIEMIDHTIVGCLVLINESKICGEKDERC